MIDAVYREASLLSKESDIKILEYIFRILFQAPSAFI